jgi:hypothetical protein
MRYLKDYRELTPSDVPLRVYGSPDCSDCCKVLKRLQDADLTLQVSVVDIKTLGSDDYQSRMKLIFARSEIALQNDKIPIVMTHRDDGAVRWEDWPTFEASLPSKRSVRKPPKSCAIGAYGITDCKSKIPCYKCEHYRP